MERSGLSYIGTVGGGKEASKGDETNSHRFAFKIHLETHSKSTSKCVETPLAKNVSAYVQPFTFQVGLWDFPLGIIG